MGVACFSPRALVVCATRCTAVERRFEGGAGKKMGCAKQEKSAKCFEPYVWITKKEM